MKSIENANLWKTVAWVLRGGNRDMLQPSEKAAVEREKKKIFQKFFFFFFIC
jgi:hypothetical protein